MQLFCEITAFLFREYFIPSKSSLIIVIWIQFFDYSIQKI